MSRGVILANFGGPRSLEEVPSFLTELLTDVDVIRTRFPRFFEKWFFTGIAKKRARMVAHDYSQIGGKSPIFEDTERWAHNLSLRMGGPVMAFHRYLTATHADFIRQVQESHCREWTILPLYPQFSFATTGSSARFFQTVFPKETLSQMQWVRSYATHPRYVAAMQRCIADYLHQERLSEKEVVLFFSAHGLPQDFVDQGDPYEIECQSSFDAIREGFPEAHSLLAFQSKFGRGEWLRPYTSELSAAPLTWSQGRKHVVFIPLSFTSDHIETLFEIEYQYLPAIRAHGLQAYRCPALNHREDWLQAMVEILEGSSFVSTETLIRREVSFFTRQT